MNRPRFGGGFPFRTARWGREHSVLSRQKFDARSAVKLLSRQIRTRSISSSLIASSEWSYILVVLSEAWAAMA